MNDRSSIKVGDVKRAIALGTILVGLTLWVGNLAWTVGNHSERFKTQDEQAVRDAQWKLDTTDRLARIEQAVGAAPQRPDRRVAQTTGSKQ